MPTLNDMLSRTKNFFIDGRCIMKFWTRGYKGLSVAKDDDVVLSVMVVATVRRRWAEQISVADRLPLHTLALVADHLGVHKPVATVACPHDLNGSMN